MSFSCALVAGALCAAEVEGQTRALPSAGATMQASATILPSLDAASFASVPANLRVTEPFTRRSTLLVTTTRAPERTTTRGSSRADPPIARSFERTTADGLRHTIAVLY